MAPEIRVEFTGNEQLIYAPGEKVAGDIIVATSDELKLSAITARFRGKSHNRWYDGARKCTYDKQEYYVDNTVQLWSKDGATSSETQLPAGVNRFPFAFELPDNAPCTFEGAVGWLRYAVYVNLDIPGNRDKTKKALITVLPKHDLNTDVRARTIPRMVVDEKVGVFSSLPIRITAYCNKGGYVPGEVMCITLDIENRTHDDVTIIRVALEQKSKFTGKAWDTRHYVKKSNAAKIKEKHVIKRESTGQWSGKMIVPSIPPSDLPGCSIIDLKFRLQFKIKCSKNITFKLPVTIGTIPLISETDTFSPDPPSYLRSVFGSVDAREGDSEELLGGDYTPLYTYYKWSDH